MNPEDIILSKVSRKEDAYCMIPLIEVLTHTQKVESGCQRQAEAEHGSQCVSGTEFQWRK